MIEIADGMRQVDPRGRRLARRSVRCASRNKWVTPSEELSIKRMPRLAPRRDGMLIWLVLALILSLFIPDPISMEIGSLKITPAFAIAIILFPLLIGMGNIRWDWPELVIVGMYACWFISNARSAAIESAIETTGRNLLVGLVPYMAGRYLAIDVRRLTKAFTLAVTLLAIFSLLAICESFARFNIHSFIWDIPYRPHHETRLGMTRAHGWTTHAIMFGLVCAVLMPIVLVSFIEKMRAVGPLPIVKLFCLGVGCFFSLSTGAWMPAAIALMLVAWDYLFKIKTSIRWPLTYATAIIGYFVLEYASGRPLLRILMMKLHLTSPDAWYYRWRLYERVFEVMPGHWWMGHGLVIPDAFVGFQRSIDNNYLLMLLLYGRVGLVLWIGVFVAVLLYGGKAVWAGRDSSCVRFTRSVMFCLIGIAMTQLSVALFSTPAMLYWMLLGVAVGATQACRKEARQMKLQEQGRKLHRRMSHGDEKGDRAAPQWGQHGG